MMTLPPLRIATDPRSLLARVQHAEKRERMSLLVHEIQEKDRLARAAAREMVEARLPAYEDLPMGARS